jgi:hypothetical protein
VSNPVYLTCGLRFVELVFSAQQQNHLFCDVPERQLNEKLLVLYGTELASDLFAEILNASIQKSHLRHPSPPLSLPHLSHSYFVLNHYAVSIMYESIWLGNLSLLCLADVTALFWQNSTVLFRARIAQTHTSEKLIRRCNTSN